MEEKKELQQTADALLGNGITITVDVQAATWYDRLLQQWKWRPAQRTFIIKPLVLGSLIRVSKLLLSIDNSLLTKDLLEDRFGLFNANYALMQKHSGAMATIIAIAVTNTKAEPSEKLVNFFLYNLTPKELSQLFAVVVSQMDVVSFTSSIISVRGLNVLESKDASATGAGMNPQTQGSQIASGASSEG